MEYLTFPHSVKYNGKFYEAYEKIPEADSPSTNEAKPDLTHKTGRPGRPPKRQQEIEV